jgi:hypothetical protein
MSSTPVSQLAAVFSSAAPPTQPQQAPPTAAFRRHGGRQGSPAAVDVGPASSSSSHPPLQGIPVQLSQSTPPGQLSQGTPVQLSRWGVWLGWFGLGWVGLGWVGLGLVGFGLARLVALVSTAQPRHTSPALQVGGLVWFDLVLFGLVGLDWLR